MENVIKESRVNESDGEWDKRKMKEKKIENVVKEKEEKKRKRTKK